MPTRFAADSSCISSSSENSFGWFAGVGLWSTSVSAGTATASLPTLVSKAINYTDRKIIPLFEMGVTHDCTAFHCWGDSR